MYSNQTADLAAAHQRDLMAAADARRLSRQFRAERREASTFRVRRAWMRRTTGSTRPAPSQG